MVKIVFFWLGGGGCICIHTNICIHNDYIFD